MNDVSRLLTILMTLRAAFYSPFFKDMGSSSSKRAKLDNIEENHIIIAVIGLTGVGKSTFINNAVKESRVEVGHGLKPKSLDVQYVDFRVRLDGNEVEQQVIFVEAPGFDFDRDEEKMAKKLEEWLKKAASKNLKISGVLYLHRITDLKLSNPPIQHLVLLRKLCEQSIKGFPNRIVLVTTMWDLLKSEATGEERERELQKYWDTLPSGSVVSRVMRFDLRTPDPAMSIVEALMKRN
ncbi:hypothetical protein D9756_003448 [Leucocoprinus leucothites]|uniref:G domain-containing protein n=1 Tax=Leucocoprinus leucothites TaxID=201217 RepID=A0A8H5G6S1_9AGAR|nr:hypothetical protein D9756_003448 [Leucoagaricus leucothites]